MGGWIMKTVEAQWETIMQAEDVGERVKARNQSAGTMSEAEQDAMAAYIDMLGRCYMPAHPAYADEGARGIRVCDRWLAGFHNFMGDVGLPPQIGLMRRQAVKP